MREREIRHAGQAEETFTKGERTLADDAAARHCQIEQCRASIPQRYAGEKGIHSESRVGKAGCGQTKHGRERQAIRSPAG